MPDTMTVLCAAGDARYIYAAEGLSRRFTVFSHKLSPRPRGTYPLSDLADIKGAADVLLLPMLAGAKESEQGLFIPAGAEKLCLRTLLPALKPGALVIGGRIPPAVRELFASAGFEVEDCFDRPELVMRNAVPTAEGALMLAMQEQVSTVFGSRVLITGFGTVAKAVARLFSGAGAEVVCAVRRAEAAAEAEVSGYGSLMLPLTAESVSGFDTVINTVPAMIMGRDVLGGIGEKSLIIELASLPGGVDRQAAAELGVRCIHAPGLPGKVAPAAAGEYIAEAAANIIISRTRKGCEKERRAGNVT